MEYPNETQFWRVFGYFSGALEPISKCFNRTLCIRLFEVYLLLRVMVHIFYIIFLNMSNTNS